MKELFKYLHLFWIAFFFLTSCAKDDFEDFYPSLENSRLTKVFNYSSSADPEPGTYMDLEYDEEGNLFKELLYDYPNTLFTFREYVYENSLLTEKRIFDGEAGNLRLGTYSKYEYANGNLVKEDLFLADGTLKRTKHYEFVDGNLVNTYSVSDELGIHHQYKYTYNELNLVILEEKFMYDQKLDGFTKYYYDDKSRLTKTEIFNFDKTIVLTEESKYIGDSALPSEEFYYDSDGNLSQHYQHVYDHLRNLIETKIIDSQGTNTLFKKKYKGNLLVEHIQYTPNFGFSEWYVTRYKYSKIR